MRKWRSPLNILSIVCMILLSVNIVLSVFIIKDERWIPIGFGLTFLIACTLSASMRLRKKIKGE